MAESYGELAHRLVLQSKQSLNLAKLLPYDGPLVQSVIQEQKDLERSIQGMTAEGILPDHPLWPKLIIQARVVQQNKRCLLAYHSQRLDIIRTTYWAATRIPDEVQNNMSKEEVEYFRHYRESVLQFRDEFASDDILDLLMDVENPPRESPLITVETVVPTGPIHTESGLMDFKMGSRYVVCKSHIGHLILQGYLREIASM
ncbi:hypothetical protein R3P38DRAFT_2774892 [Favolaschia claudopus]|uniref:DNA replication complex GINS protein PSF1 n=1 Tax=Favolaschia claudopus TaxID=2862362 RepID=A0AAW0BUS1_9AGAR